MSKPRKPARLGTQGARFWQQVAGEYELRPDEIVLLETACRTLDTIAQLDAAMAGEPLTTRGSLGQLREHPLLSEARQQRMTLARLLRQLALPEPDEIAAIRDAARSKRGRAAARARWSA